MLGLNRGPPSRSAIVRATLRMRSCARAVSPCCIMARSNRRSQSAESSQKRGCGAAQVGHCSKFVLGRREALQLQISRARNHSLTNLCGVLGFRARPEFFIVHRRYIDMDVDAVEQAVPEIFDMYRWITGGVQWHSRLRSLKYPHGTRVHRGRQHEARRKVRDMAARAIQTVPSSSGWRMTSSTLRGNSGSSSRNRTPL